MSDNRLGPDEIKQGCGAESMLPVVGAAYIPNPFPNKDMLTVSEALEAVSSLSTMVLLDERKRGR